jgi:hypothetical protein
MFRKLFSKTDRRRVVANKQIRHICWDGEEEDIPILCGLLSQYPELVNEKVDDGFRVFDNNTPFEKSFLRNNLSPKISLAIWRMGENIFDHNILGMGTCPEFMPILSEHLERGGSPNEFDKFDEGRSLLNYASQSHNYLAVEELKNHNDFDMSKVIGAMCSWSNGPYITDYAKTMKNRPHLFSDEAALRTFSILNELIQTDQASAENVLFTPETLWKKSILKNHNYKILPSNSQPIFIFHEEEKEAFSFLQAKAKEYQSIDFYIWIIDEYCKEINQLIEDMCPSPYQTSQEEAVVELEKLYETFNDLN